jgi:hypothetical protein
MEVYLLEMDLKPAEGEEGWQSYFDAMEQLKKGVTAIRKARKVTTARSRHPRAPKGGVKKKQGPAVSKGTRMSTRRTSNLVSIVEEDEKSAETMREEESQSSPHSSPRSVMKRPLEEEEEEIEFQSSPEPEQSHFKRVKA